MLFQSIAAIPPLKYWQRIIKSYRSDAMSFSDLNMPIIFSLRKSDRVGSSITKSHPVPTGSYIIRGSI